MEKRFILQTYQGLLGTEAATVWETISAVNDWNQENPNGCTYRFETASLTEINTQQPILSTMPFLVPVGSLDFCTKIAESQGCPHLTALNIPIPLRDEEFTGRNVFDVASSDELMQLLRISGKLLVKPGDTVKRFEAMSVSSRNVAALTKDNPGPYFVSEILKEDILAEWRFFFFRGRIISAHPYVMEAYVAPDLAFAETILATWKSAPPAGTLDVAILENGRNVLIEAHPFIACGLYGFDPGEVLLRMLIAAWNWQIATGSTPKT